MCKTALNIYNKFQSFIFPTIVFLIRCLQMSMQRETLNKKYKTYIMIQQN